MEIKRFKEFNENTSATTAPEYNIDDVDITGLRDTQGRTKVHTGPDRRQQNFSDYYHGRRIVGKSKYELNDAVFKMAERDDEIGILAQYILQLERDSMAMDYEIKSDTGTA